MELIRKWLSGNKNFIVGAILYKKFGTDEKLKKLFEGRPDAYLQKRLEDELSKLANGKGTHPLKGDKVDMQAVSDGSEMPDSKDPVLKALRNEWLLPYKRMCYLQTELDRIEGNSEEAIAKRKPIAFEILELEQQCMAVWKRRNHYEKEGKLPEVKESEFVIPDDPFELQSLIDTTKRNIRRNKQLAKDHPDKPQYPLLQKKYEQQLEEIMKHKKDGKQSA